MPEHAVSSSVRRLVVSALYLPYDGLSPEGMHTTLLERGDFVVLILPEALLEELGITAGTAMDVRIEKNSIIATPLRTRDGWAEDANRIGAEPLARAERDWLAFSDDRDESLS